MVSLLDSCPEERSLVHGYCGGGHVVIQGDKIVGVLDWIDSFYGDFVYDIASLDFWMPRLQLPEHFQQYYAAKGIAVPAFAERLRCCQCYMALSGLRFFAKFQNRDAYHWTRERVIDIIR